MPVTTYPMKGKTPSQYDDPTLNKLVDIIKGLPNDKDVYLPLSESIEPDNFINVPEDVKRELSKYINCKSLF